MPEKVRAAFNQLWAAAAKAARDDVETQRQALEAMRREMDKEKADMAAEIERLERELEEAAGKVETAGRELEAEHKGRVAAEKQVTDIRIENARLDERIKAAEGVADELREQLKPLNERFVEVSRQKRQTQRGAKSPKPKET
jgi:chromosome segregation ATPase